MSLDGFVCAGQVLHRGLNLDPLEPPPGRLRHAFGGGPFARLVMPPLPAGSGLYIWQRNDTAMYIGQTRTPLAKRLGSNGYSTISTYNTLAREPERKNGGQQTNCRVNTLANAVLVAGHTLTIWHRVMPPGDARLEEARWMAAHGKPEWNRRLEHMPRSVMPGTGVHAGAGELSQRPKAAGVE